MIKHLYVSKKLDATSIDVVSVAVEYGSRVRRGMVMLMLRQEGVMVPIRSEHDGWVRFAAVEPKQSVEIGDLMLIIDVMESIDYRVDPAEFSTDTELGQEGRRGLERAGQEAFGEAARALFEATQQEAGMGQFNGLQQHPMMQNMKEGVPPKMSSDAANNPEAIKDLENASSDPDLKIQLGQELQKQLDMQAGPSIAPTPRPGG
jgi:hypothetical protein